jgi:hypothetical protein
MRSWSEIADCRPAKLAQPANSDFGMGKKNLTQRRKAAKKIDPSGRQEYRKESEDRFLFPCFPF